MREKLIDRIFCFEIEKNSVESKFQIIKFSKKRNEITRN